MTWTTLSWHPLSHQREDDWFPTYDLTCNRPRYAADVQWNRVSNLEPFGPDAETLPLGLRMIECISFAKQMSNFAPQHADSFLTGKSFSTPNQSVSSLVFS
ncbi:hypothetical protein AVEN_48972-1 [Araneus ventricosus]|uniref:Uncharacterized protein n=1 Tax=Araneus ventricosus TaxID=182803 RepID=A0A4Y2AID4_ARAVE|nr:hypothetical protein AVEN_48972-1 [Araneus ventricosus]